MRMSWTNYLMVAAMLASVAAQAQDSREAVQQKLTSVYKLTHTNGDETDILSAGTILVLKKDNLVMVPLANPTALPNTFKEGRISQNKLLKGFDHIPGVPKPRKFVATEKMWVTQIEVKNDAVVFDLLSDPFEDVRYKGMLRFPFAKGTVPQMDLMEKTIAEVFEREMLGGKQPQPVTPPPPITPPPPPVAAPPPLVPPPPPSDAAPTATQKIAIGQTPAQVTAILGQPQRIVNAGAKQIYIYPSMKVIFVGNKVSDVQ
jgi:hypothetical protein